MIHTASQAAASSIHDILATRGIVPHFQPIVSVRGKTIVGLEALSRGADGDTLIGAPTLFRLAEQAGLRDAIGRICREECLRRFRAAAADSDLLLFLNLDVPARRTAKAIAQDVLSLAADNGLTPADMIVEVLETEFGNVERLRALTDTLHDHGFRIALDDIGAWHADVDQIAMIRPDVMKIDRALIAGVDADRRKRATLERLIDLGQQIGALVVVEGIETEAEAIASLELGADLLQGFLLCQPMPYHKVNAATLGAALARAERLSYTL